MGICPGVQMKCNMISFLFRVTLVPLAVLPALSQTSQGNASQTPAATKGRAPENLPWTRFHPAAPPYRPTDTEKQQIQAKIDQLDGMIRELRSTHVMMASWWTLRSMPRRRAGRWRIPRSFFARRRSQTLSARRLGIDL